MITTSQLCEVVGVTLPVLRYHLAMCPSLKPQGRKFNGRYRWSKAEAKAVLVYVHDGVVPLPHEMRDALRGL